MYIFTVLINFMWREEGKFIFIDNDLFSFMYVHATDVPTKIEVNEIPSRLVGCEAEAKIKL